jgi:hypothetical protein
MSLNIRNNTANDGGITTDPAQQNNGNSISSDVNETVPVTFAVVNPQQKPNNKNYAYVAPPNVQYVVSQVNKKLLYQLLNQKPFVSNRKLPSLISYSPPLQNTINKLNTDSINTGVSTVANGTSQIVSNAGISALDLRPEIISMLDLAPIWKKQTKPTNTNSILERLYTDSGMFVKFQYQTKQLRQETLISTIKQIKNVLKQDTAFDPIRTDYLKEITYVQNALMFYKNIIDNIDIIKNSFEIRMIGDDSFKTNDGTLVTPLKKFYTENLGYKTAQYDAFSETKLLLQLMFELNVRLKNYSSKFLDQLLIGRASDLSPININTSEDVVGYKFDINNFTSQNNSPLNAASSDTFQSFLNSLPSEVDSRIKLLTYLLAKEYIVSSNLGNSKNDSVFKPFNVQSIGNPFPSILGDIPNTILKLPVNKNGMSALPFFGLSRDNNVLVFENKFIDDPTNTNISWIPGQNYYTEQIINPAGNTWDISAYEAYISNYLKVMTAGISAIKALLGIAIQGTTNQYITPSKLNRRILECFYTAFDKVTPQEEEVAARFDPASYAQKLALQQSRKELEEKLKVEREKIPNGEITLNNITPDGSSTDPNGPFRPHPDDLNREIDKIKNPPIIKALEQKIEELNRKINELNVPDPTVLQVTLEQALIMNIFNAASENELLKRLLFQYCILAGLIRNKTSDTNGLFNVLAANEINSVEKLDSVPGAAARDPSREFEEFPSTVNGSDLVKYIKDLASGIAAVYTQSRNGSTNNSVAGFGGAKKISVIISETDIPTVLERAALGQGTIGNVNLIYQYVNLANDIFKSSQINGANVQLLPDNSGRTRFNSISTSTQLFMLFEIFCQYAKKYSFIDINKSSQDVFGSVVTSTSSSIINGGNVRLDRDGDMAEYTDSVAAEFKTTTTTTTETKTGVLTFYSLNIDLTNTGLVQKAIGILTKDYKEDEAQSERQNNEYFISLEDNKKKIDKEYSDMSDILGIFEVIGNNLNSSLNKVKQFFNQTTLKTFLATNPIPNLNLVKNKSQLRISAQTFEDIKQKTIVPLDFISANSSGQQSTQTKEIELIVSDAVLPQEYSILEKMMKNYVAGNDVGEETIKRNFKVLSVGIPTGFTKALSDRINKGDINNVTFKDRQSDLININVFVRNAKYPELVFKPTKYIFDTSLFLTKKNIINVQPQDGESYLAILNRLMLTDFDNPFSPVEIDLPTLRQDPKYGFLTDQQFMELYINHTNSYLFGLYMSLFTGVKPSEDTFTFPEIPERVLNSKMRSILIEYLKRINLPIPANLKTTSEVIADPNIPDEVKDHFRLFTYGSLVMNTNEVSNRVLTPKLYDRIFYLPIQTYLMEIDIQRTKIYNPDINFDLYRENMVFDTRNPNQPKYFIRDGKPEDFIVKDLFVQVETVADQRKFSDQLATIAGSFKALIPPKSITNIIKSPLLRNGPSLGNIPAQNNNSLVRRR